MFDRLIGSVVFPDSGHCVHIGWFRWAHSHIGVLSAALNRLGIF